jgi:autotransporter translocation and assembly factor TamB
MSTDPRTPDVPAPNGESETQPGDGERSKAGGGLGRSTVKWLAWIGAGFLILGFFVLETAAGNRVVLQWGLDRVRAAVAGSLDVGDIRSANLLRGARLIDIRMLTPEGDTLVVADSLEASYSVGALLDGRLGVSDVRLWGARVEYAQASDGGASTLQRWIGVPEPDSSEAGSDDAPRSGGVFSGFSLDRVELRDVAFRLRIPTDLAPDGLVRVEAADTVAGVDRLALDVEIEEALVPRVRIGGPGAPTDVRVARASARVDALREPLFVDRLAANIRVANRGVTVDLEDLLMAEVRARGPIRVSLDAATDSVVDLSLDLRDLDTRELQWVSDQLPPLVGSTRLQGRIRQGGSEWTAEGATLDWDGADLRGGGTLALSGGPMRLEGVEVRTSGLQVESLRRWLPEGMESGGRLGGRLAADGTLSRLDVDAEVTWTTPLGEPVALRGAGAVTGLDRGAGVGFDGFSAVLGPFEWSTLRRSAGIPVPIDGPGSLQAELFGSLETGLRVSGEARHLGGVVASTSSRVLIDGIVRVRNDVVGLDLSADLAPLALDVIRLPADSTGASPQLPLDGTLSGSVRLTGDTNALRVSADLRDGVGELRVDVDLNPRDPTSGYAVSGTASGLSGAVFTALGEATSISGEFSVAGRGASLERSELQMSGRFTESRISGLPIDSLVVGARVTSGQLAIDSLRGRLGGFGLVAEGTLAIADSLRSGTIQAEFATESLLGLRSTFLGDSVLARPRDGLERRALEAEGIDPDTLPSPEQVEWDGAVEGRATLTGSLDAFDLDGSAVATGVRIGPNRVDSVWFTARGTGWPGEEAAVTVDATADSLIVFDRSFSTAQLEGTLGRKAGEFVLELARGAEEAYTAEGGYDIEDSLRRVRLDAVSVRFDSLEYQLQRPTSVVWGDSALTVDDLEIRRLGPEPVVIRANGRLPQTGEVAFDVSVEGLYLDRLTQVLQRSDIDVGGRIDFVARVGGTAANPVAEATLTADSLRWRRLEVAGLTGRVEYADRVAVLELLADRGGDIVLDVAGEIPVDLALVPGTDRFPAREMYVEVVANDLPARATVAPLQDLENVEGLVSGRFEIEGTLQEPRTSGSLALEGGAWTVGSLGVRHTDVNGTAVLGDDNVLDVDIRGRADGTVEVDGTITLETLTDPTFDLRFAFDRFRGVDRRDLEGLFSGEVQLTETYRSPYVTGSLVVDEGNLFIDEWVRSSQVVDLTDTRTSGLLGTDTERRLLQIEGNPFMNGLRTEIDVAIDSDTWLDGANLRVEMVGEITMFFNRRARDFALDGELTARRGQYTTAGRTFQVQEGTVQFLGTPGINPVLDISATTRVRRQEFGDLTVTANVAGTLLQPRVTFTADEESLSESDIYSFLLTGQPSSGIISSLGGSSNQAFGTVANTGFSLLAGTIFSRLGALAAQQTDVIDYLAITGGSDLGVGSGTAFGSTQVEVGRYFAGGDIFGAVVFRAADLGTQPVGGARLEWQSSEQFHIEAFFEDRFLRVASVGLAELGAGSAYVFGFALVREWGY